MGTRKGREQEGTGTRKDGGPRAHEHRCSRRVRRVSNTGVCFPFFPSFYFTNEYLYYNYNYNHNHEDRARDVRLGPLVLFYHNHDHKKVARDPLGPLVFFFHHHHIPLCYIDGTGRDGDGDTGWGRDGEGDMQLASLLPPSPLKREDEGLGPLFDAPQASLLPSLPPPSSHLPFPPS